MLKVFITIDTEFWPRKQYRPDSQDHLDDFQRDIHGHTPDGDFGLGFQLDALSHHGLRAVCLVEALNSFAVGLEPLREMVRLVREKGHDLQLHLHTEWLSWMPQSILPGRSGQNMHQFSEDEQSLLIASGLAKMRECGADNICAFRAGNYGADLGTLRALARNGILYDTSHNTGYLDSTCHIHVDKLLVQPEKVAGVLEVPISFFRDLRGVRHAQLAACSSAELEYALLEAWKQGWQSFVIVSHSFELLRRSKTKMGARVDTVVLRRFERLCRFLKANEDKFETCTFSDAPTFSDPAADSVSTPIRMQTIHTLGRFLQQLRRRLPL